MLPPHFVHGAGMPFPRLQHRGYLLPPRRPPVLFGPSRPPQMMSAMQQLAQARREQPYFDFYTAVAEKGPSYVGC